MLTDNFKMFTDNLIIFTDQLNTSPFEIPCRKVTRSFLYLTIILLNANLYNNHILHSEKPFVAFRDNIHLLTELFVA